MGKFRTSKIKLSNLLPTLAAMLAILGLMPLAGNARAQALPEPTRFINTGILAWHLSTNAVAYARGYEGNWDDMWALTGWRYAQYSGTNFAFLTNARWSTNFWLHVVRGLSATSLGASNSLGAEGLITMVSPRHYLFATHMQPQGFLTGFLGTNNVLYWRKTLERVDVGDDTSVGIINEDLPPSVGYMPVLPPDFAKYLPTNASAFIQGIGVNQNWRVFSQPMTFMFPGLVVWSSRGAAPFGLSTNWNITIRAGDSSNPDMLLIGDQLVLVTHTESVQAGPNYALQFDAINRKMHYLSTHNHVGSDYQLTPFSLTNWPVVNP